MWHEKCEINSRRCEWKLSKSRTIIARPWISGWSANLSEIKQLIWHWREVWIYPQSITRYIFLHGLSMILINSASPHVAYMRQENHPWLDNDGYVRCKSSFLTTPKATRKIGQGKFKLIQAHNHHITASCFDILGMNRKPVMFLTIWLNEFSYTNMVVFVICT